MVDTTLFQTLKKRGLLYQCTDEEALKKLLESGKPVTLYEGTDPTQAGKVNLEKLWMATP